jgi:hypothetical protein
MKNFKKFNIKKTALINDYLRMRSINLEKVNMSRGNKKLVSNDSVLFLVWNLPAVKTCPNATNMCKGACYALKAEIAYPNCYPSRKRNLLDSMRAGFIDRVKFTILSAIANDKKHRKIVVRIHESGDFYTKAYADAWLSIADYFKSENVTFIAYTKSFSFFDGVKLPKNFKLRASIWADTSEKDLEMIHRNNWNIYTAVDSFKKGDKFTRCRCSDCGTCQKCWRNYKDIRCEIH